VPQLSYVTTLPNEMEVARIEISANVPVPSLSGHFFVVRFSYASEAIVRMSVSSSFSLISASVDKALRDAGQFLTTA
jgi:hypothetical protein